MFTHTGHHSGAGVWLNLKSACLACRKHWIQSPTLTMSGVVAQKFRGGPQLHSEFEASLGSGAHQE